MIDENDIVADTPKIWTITCSGGIDKVRIGEMFDEQRYLGTHAMLLPESLVRITFEDKSFE